MLIFYDIPLNLTEFCTEVTRLESSAFQKLRILFIAFFRRLCQEALFCISRLFQMPKLIAKVCVALKVSKATYAIKFVIYMR